MSRALSILAALLVALVFGLLPGAPATRALAFVVAPPLPKEVTDRSGSLVVTAVDGAGGAIAGASVVALSIVDGRAYEAGRAETDSAGHATLASLPAGDTWLLGNAAGRARASSHFLLVGTRDVVLTFEAEHAIDVVVRDAEGKPIDDATIEARAGGPLPVGAKTDAAGRAHVGRLPNGPFSVAVSKDGYDGVTERAKDGDTIAITLRRLGSIVVHVKYASGAAVPSARVQIAGSSLWPARDGRTGEHGGVKLAGLYAGSYALRASLGSLASQTEMGVLLASGEEREVDLVLEQGRSVTVRVVDGDGDDAEPIKDARVVVTEGGLSPFPFEATTNALGSATLGPVAPGAAYASARAESYVARQGVLVPEPLTGVVTIALAKAGTVSGRVVDARGFPVSGATLEIVGTDFSGQPIDDDPRKSLFRDAQFDAVLAPSALVPAGELGVVPGPVPPIPRAGDRVLGFAPPANAPESAPWVTRSDGTFELTPVTPGRVRVLVRHPEFIETLSDVATLSAAGKVDELTIVMRQGGDLEGRVVDDSGRPAQGARVEITSTRGSFSRATHTATDGTFAFSALPESCSLDVYRDDDALHPAARVSIAVPEGGKREITVTLSAPRDSCEVHVHDDRGYPVAAAQISLASVDPSVPLRETAFTSDRGEATLEEALGLAVRVEIRAPGHAPKVLSSPGLPKTSEVTLEPSISVTGEVRAARGGERPSATVVFYTDLGPKNAVVRDDGSFRVDDLAPGPARVGVRAPGYAALEKALVLVASTSGRLFDAGRLELEEEAIATGRVVDPKGNAVQGARVSKDHAPTFVAGGATPPGVAITDKNGHFTLHGLAEGALVLEAYAPDVGTGRAAVKANAGRTTSDVTITLTPSGDAQKEPAATGGVAVTLGETSGEREVVIVAVAPSSEAERAGLAPDDTVLAIDGAAVSTIEEARGKLSGPIEQDVVVKVRRGAREETLRVPREAVRR